MIIWIVQKQRTRKSLPEARIFKTWPKAIKYIDTLKSEQMYMKPILFSATVRGDKQ